MESKLSKRLEAMLLAFGAGNGADLKRIGNDAIADAVLQSDDGLATLSIIAYSLYKILGRQHFVQNKRWPMVAENIKKCLEKSMNALKQENQAEFSKQMANVISSIEEIDNELSNYAKSIYEKAKVKQASTAYAFGLSMNKAAELTKADKNELQHYIGITRIHDEQPAGPGIGQRLRALKEVLGK